MPDAEETISYSIPAYRIGGRVALYFAGWREHFSIYPSTDRLVVGTPERLSLPTLTALCDILSCTPNDLIEVAAEPGRLRKAAGAKSATTAPTGGRRPVRARIVEDHEH